MRLPGVIILNRPEVREVDFGDTGETGRAVSLHIVIGRDTIAAIVAATDGTARNALLRALGLSLVTALRESRVSADLDGGAK